MEKKEKYSFGQYLTVFPKGQENLYFKEYFFKIEKDLFIK